MKKIYSSLLLLIVAVVFTGCSKDIFKPYEDRIEGTWDLTDVDKIGWGNSDIGFDGGRFTFYGSGRVNYEDGYGGFFEGDWNMRSRNIPDCYIDENGATQCDNRYVQTLQVNVADFSNHTTRSEYFDEIIFTSTNRFKAYIYERSRTYVFHFSRR